MTNARKWKFVAALLALPLAGCQTVEPFAGLQAGIASPSSPPMPEAAGGASAMRKAGAYFGAGDFGLAADAYKKAVEAQPDNAQAWLGLAASYDELRRFDLADRAYRQALRINGPTLQLLNNRGYSHLLRGDSRAARRDLAAARAKDPENIQVQRNLALSRH